MAAPEEKLKVGFRSPVKTGTWWEFKGYPFTVKFFVNGWGLNQGLIGDLHIGPIGQSPPIRVCMSEMGFIRLVNGGQLEQVAAPPEL